MSIPATSGQFSQTLSAITNIKFAELSKKRAAFESHRTAIKTSISKPDITPQQKVRELIDGTKKISGMPTSDDTLKMFEWGLELAKYDRSVSAETVEGWASELEAGFSYEEQRFIYADLFAKLLQEWLSTVKPAEHGSDGESEKTGEGKRETADSEAPEFEKVGRKEMHEQRARFEEFVFTASETDKDAIITYLDELFGDEESKIALRDLRKSIKQWCKTLLNPISEDDVKSSIKALLKQSLLSNEKNATLKEFENNNIVLKEIADVLNMQLASISSWSWPKEGIPVEMRRQLNGKYRVYMDEPLLDAIFLQHVGIRWCVAFKNVFTAFFSSEAWPKASAKPLGPQASEDREYYLDESPTAYDSSIEAQRVARQKDRYFMNQLATSVDEGKADYDDDGSDADTDIYRPSESPVQPKTPGFALRQDLLHLMTVESLLNVHIHGGHTVVRSDFEWFGPSLAHSSILTTLRFLGVTEQWIGFFQTFLQAPLKFTHDGPDAELRVRARGVPMSHALSDLFGETMLFAMDFAVSKKAGLFLYRIHDDFWWWSPSSEDCVSAWNAMNEFTSILGLKFNQEKTGSVTINAPPNPQLPKGDIRWGFLKLSPSGRFEIDQASVDEHIAELRLQLSSCKSVFAWVLAYNKYMTFFFNNFAQPAVCFGTQHLDQIASTLERIHNALFPDHDGSVVDYLSSVIKSRFHVPDAIPAGWFYWPTRLGGLELKNHFITISSVRCVNNIGQGVPKDPAKMFRECIKDDEISHRRLEKEWAKNGRSPPPGRNLPAHLLMKYKGDVPFIKYEDYILGRELRSPRWARAYKKLLRRVCSPRHIVAPPAVKAAVDQIKFKEPLAGSDAPDEDAWIGVNSYWKWVLAVWGEDMMKRWGGLEVVHEGSLPVGMVAVWRSMRVTWEQ